MVKYLLTILLFISLMVACDDTGSTVNPTTSPNIGEISFDWLGDFTDHPSICDADTEYDAYYNTTEGKSYFCDGIDWRMLAQDGTAGTNGTDGTDGVDGKTIQVLDSNSTLLGYSIDLSVLMSPTGYLYSLKVTASDSFTFEDPGYRLYFLSSDCTGEAIVHTHSDAAFRNILVYNSITDTFHSRRDATVHTTTANSYVFDGTCSVTSLVAQKFYKFDPITRTDSGVPETIVAPLTYEFK